MSKAQTREMKLFENFVHSPHTIFGYKNQIKAFVKWAKFPNWEHMLSLDSKELKIILEDYVMEKRRTCRAITVRGCTFAIQAFLDANDYDMNWKKIRRLIGKDDTKSNSRPWTTSEAQQMYAVANTLKNKTLILVLSSSGIRRGAIPNMKLKDLKDMPLGCKAVTCYAGTVDEYTTFINQEAVSVLEQYLARRKSKGEVITPESYVIARSAVHNAHIPIQENTISYLVHHLKEKAGLKGNGIDNQLCHAFRRRFDTIFKLRDDCNVSLTERLMGHSVSVQLDNHYFQPSVDDLFKEYLKGVEELTLDDTERLRIENEVVKQDLDELQKERESNRDLSQRLTQMEDNQAEFLRAMKLVQEGHATFKQNELGDINVTLKPKDTSVTE